jgi:hemoglobin
MESEAMDAKEALYTLVGGESGVKALVETFYDIVENEPEGVALNVLHLRGHGIAHSRIEQFNFLCGFFGGPKLYAEKHGHSNVRKMHEHVEISAEARDAWLKCMEIAIERLEYPSDLKLYLMGQFGIVARALQNTD